jgi:hypothetical protein
MSAVKAIAIATEEAAPTTDIVAADAERGIYARIYTRVHFTSRCWQD